MKTTTLPIRTQLVCQNLWKIEREEKELLDRFFILYDSGESFFKDITKRENPRYPYESEYFLKGADDGDNTSWNIRFLKPIEYLKKLGPQQLALSFREHKMSGLAWVVVNEWLEKDKMKKETSIEEPKKAVKGN